MENDPIIERGNAEAIWWLISRVGAVVLLLIVLVMAGCPTYRVWQQEMRGKAALREATWNRQIAVEEARATLESASMRADAEVTRAVGLAAAADSVISVLGSSDAYLRYLWINTIPGTPGERIYIPTEANLPILEARDQP
jgi:hypothetical protein